MFQASPARRALFGPGCLLLAGLATAPTVGAQESCGTWGGGFSHPGVSARVRAIVSFDPAGPAPARVVVGGDFTATQTCRADRIAQWDGEQWSALGSGLNGPVSALLVHDDGAGARLVAGGNFTHAGTVPASAVAQWDGGQWSSLGGGLIGSVMALARFDDGTGPALFATGAFTVPGDAAPSNLARWNGTSWSAVGGGLDAPGFALTVFDDGVTEKLYVGGQFTHAGGSLVHFVTSWDGVAFAPLGSGAQSSVYALAGHVDQGVLYLFAGGDFAGAGGIVSDKIARWNGTAWSAVGAGLNQRVSALLSFNDGTGPALYVGGSFNASGAMPLPRIACWRNGGFQGLPGASPNAPVEAFCVFDDPVAGPELILGGRFTSIGSILRYVARWTGTQFAALGRPQVVDDDVNALASFDHGTGFGPQVFIAGDFTFVNGIDTRRVARWWNGDLWPMAPAIQTTSGGTRIEEFAVYQPAGAPSPLLLACGSFRRFEGNAFEGVAVVGPTGLSSFGFDLPGSGDSMAVWDGGTGPALWVAGFYYEASLGNYFLGRYDGAVWTPVPSAGGVAFPRITELEVFDAGNGPELYFAGPFTALGGAAAGGVGRFDGIAIHTLAGGVSGAPSIFAVNVLRTGDLGDGAALYVGGAFTQAGALPASGIARWNGSEWSALGAGVIGSQTSVDSMIVHDEGLGGGAELCVGGSFSTAGGLPTAGAARWNGVSWRTLAGGFVGRVRAFAVHDEGGGAKDLYAGGDFVSAGGATAVKLARLESCGPITTYCTGDGQDEFATSGCPCGNVGAVGRGCAWSGNPDGAVLEWTGSNRPDTLVLRASGMPATSGATVFWKGSALLREGIAWGDGMRCLDGALIRLGTKTNVAGAAQYPEVGNASVSVRGQTPVGSGSVGYYQTTYRNAASFCTPFTYNATNAVRVVW